MLNMHSLNGCGNKTKPHQTRQAFFQQPDSSVCNRLLIMYDPDRMIHAQRIFDSATFEPSDRNVIFSNADHLTCLDQLALVMGLLKS